MSQLLGYTGPVSAEQLGELKTLGYLPDDLIGKTGLEATYETELRGVYGTESVERNASGRRIQVLQTIREAQPGNSLTLTIDTKAQRDAQKALKWAMGEIGIKRGIVIAMNPQTGEILAMVSLPTYDNNAFARGISNAAYEKLLKNPDKPLINHAVQALYPPGSTYKLVTGTGGARRRKISATTKIATKGYLTLGTTRFYDWNRRGFGPCDIYCGFGHSSDTYFFQLAGRLGIDRLAYWAEQYGFGSPTGIDLPGEVAGSSRRTNGSWTRSAPRSSRARRTRRASARATTSSRRSSSSTPTPRSRTAGRSTSRSSSGRSSGRTVRS